MALIGSVVWRIVYGQFAVIKRVVDAICYIAIKPGSDITSVTCPILSFLIGYYACEGNTNMEHILYALSLIMSVEDLRS